MDLDFRVVVVLLPIALAGSWAVCNIAKLPWLKFRDFSPNNDQPAVGLFARLRPVDQQLLENSPQSSSSYSYRVIDIIRKPTSFSIEKLSAFLFMAS